MLGVILLCFGLIYLGLPTYDYYFDGLTFAMAVEGVASGGDPAWLFHPHHLLYSPFAFAFYSLILALGLKIRALLAMQIMSAFLALGGLAFFYRLARKLDIAIPVSAAGTILLGSSYGYWHFATQGDTTMFLAFLMLALILLCSRILVGSVRFPEVLGLSSLLGGAALIHQTACLFVPAAVYAVWHSSSRGRRRANLTAFIGVSAALPLAVYLAVALRLGTGGLTGAVNWLLGYFAADPRTGYRIIYGSWSISDLSASARAWAACFVGTWPHAWGAGGAIWTAAAAIFIGALLSLAVVGALRALRASRSRSPKLPGDRLGTLLLIWILSHAVFFTWWKAGHTRFWVLALPAWLLLGLYGLRGLEKRGRRARLIRNACFGLSAAALILVGTGPFRYESNPRNNEFICAVGNLERLTEPRASLIISGVGRYGALKAYIPYFAQRRMMILDWQFPDRKTAPGTGLARLKSNILSMTRAGPVYVLSESLSPEIDPHFLKWHGITGEQRRALLEGFNPNPIGELSPGLLLLKL